MINQHYFHNRFNVLLKMIGKPLYFELSNKMTSTGGTTIQTADSFIIKLSLEHCLLSDDKTYMGSGQQCRGQWEALFVTLTHELVHVLVETIIVLKIKNEKITISSEGRYSSHGDLFRELALAFFNLTDITHSFFRGGVDNPIQAKPPSTQQTLSLPSMNQQLTTDSTKQQNQDHPVARKGYSYADFRVGDIIWIISPNRTTGTYDKFRRVIGSKGPKYAQLYPVGVDQSKYNPTKYEYSDLYKTDPGELAKQVQQEKTQLKRNIKVGDRVRFTDTRRNLSIVRDGTVTKLNPKRVAVRLDDGNPLLVPYDIISFI